MEASASLSWHRSARSSVLPADGFPFPVSRFPFPKARRDKTYFHYIFTPFKWFSFDAPKTFHGVLQNISSWEIQEPISRFPFPECWQLQDVQFPTRPFPISHFPLCLFHKSTSNFPFPISHLVPGISCWGAISRFPFPTSHPSSCVEAHSQFPISHFPQPLHNPGIGGVGNERSKDKVKDQFPEGDNESGEFPISHCPISNGKLGMCITRSFAPLGRDRKN